MNSDEERTEIDRSMRDFGFHVAACVKSDPGNVFFFFLIILTSQFEQSTH